MNKINLLEFLENTAEKYPNKVAFADENNEITFSLLSNRAKKLAMKIIKTTNNINMPIGVLIDRSIDSVIAMQAVLFSGNFYVPIDDKSPVLRAKSIANNANLLIFNDKNEEFAKKISNNCINSNADEEICEKTLRKIRSKILSIDPAYMIFTSGSTGVPKGIVVSHQSVIDYTDWLTTFCDYSNNEIFANQAPFYFDLSVKDLYQTLSLGATCYICPKKLFTFPHLLLKYMEEKQVTSINWATSALHLASSSLDKIKPSHIKKITVGGEALQAKYLNIWKENFSDIQFYHSYGPTEIAISCTAYKICRDFKNDEPIPIGKACKNMQILLLSDDLKLVSKGETGQICVRGIGLAQGYYNDFEKTDASFIQNPLNNKYRDIIYKTGDLAFENEYGEFVFVSRVDNQIKHNGYRIELSEIEIAINSLNAIKECVCLYKNDKIIAIYSGDIEKKQLILNLKELLPKYMIPNEYINLQNLPYNANGKIDRAKLGNEY